MHARILAARIFIIGFLVAALCSTYGSVAGTPTAGGAVSATPVWEWSNVLNDAPCGVAESSPAAFSADGAPAVEIGDREGHLYAFDLDAHGAQQATVPSGWGPNTASAPTVGGGQGCDAPGVGTGTPQSGYAGIGVPESPPIDSTASVGPSNDLYFGAGNAASPGEGGYFAYGANGSLLWNQVVTNPPTVTQELGGVQASLSLADGGSVVNGGSLGQETYSLATSSGASRPGWPFFSADSVFSTAAVADLYGTGQNDFVVGGASSAGFAFGKHYQNGGHLRILNDHGGLICASDTNEEIDSSPAVGPILAGGATGIVTGTGSFWHGSDQGTLKVYDTKCNEVWSLQLAGITGGSPALADVLGNGQLDAIEGTHTSNTEGSVYAVNVATKQVLWHTANIGAVFGSVTTVDLAGYQDVIVPTTLGIKILDGRSGVVVASFDDGSGNAGVPPGMVYGFQNAPLVTADPDGSLGITVAGYFALSGGTGVEGIVQHFHWVGSDGARVHEARAWPQFHQDPGLSGSVGGGSALGACQRPPASQSGYLTVASDGGIFSFNQDFCGSAGSMNLNKPVVGMAAVPGQGGYWLVASDGGIFSYGDAGFFGSTGSLQLNAPVEAMAPTPDGQGYWLVASDGGIFSYGDAGFYGSAASVPGQDIVGMAATPDGQGYWEVSTTGRVFSYGDAQFAGDTSGAHLNGFIVGITPNPVTGGYWLIGSDGGVFSYGAPFYGSTGGIHLNQPVVAMQSTGDGQGYWFVASDGGIFAYGDAPFRGSMGGQHLNAPMVGITGF